jgi:long-chain acyl-CoA synthetase
MLLATAGRSALGGRIIAGDRVREHAQLAERAARAAAGLRALGIGEGDTVALLLRNDFALFEASAAAALVGAYATPINWHFTADEAAYVIADSAARVVVAHADLWPRVAPAVAGGGVALLVETPPEIAGAYGIAETDCRVPPGGLAWDVWLTRHEKRVRPAPPPRSSMIYTSGTTGRPKGVRREPATPDQAAWLDEMCRVVFGFGGEPAPVVLMNGPMYHSAPNSYGLNAFRRGYDIVLQARFEAEEMLQLIERHRVSHMHIVPTMLVRLLRLPDAVKRRYDVSSLRQIVHGAAPCPPEVKRAMIEWWGDVVTEYYGSTETGIATWNTAAEALRKPGTVGRPVAGGIVRVYDDDGKELPPGQIGEIYMRAGYAPEFTYQNLPEKRAECGRRDLVTVGDVGWVDEEGYVFLCDRKRDMVISGGVNIYPAEIEAVLIGIPGVKDCAVFGIPDELYGESLCAYVEPEPGSPPPAPDALRRALEPKLARYKIPKVIEIAAELPREDSGKIFKRKLREPYWAGTGRSI